MAQVFISYKSEDRDRLYPLVRALQTAGIDVWWDAHIEGGSAWRDSIQRELESAEVIMVIWSLHSVGSAGRFVRDEANWAVERGAYLPILLDEVRLPIGFGEVQALSLIGWKDDAGDARIQALLQAVRRRVGTAAEVPASAVSSTTSPLTRRVVLTGGALGLMGMAGALYKTLRPRAAVASDTIAVLPFADMSENKDQAYFSDGLAEELRDALRRVSRLRVIGRSSCEQVKDLPAHEVAAKLSVSHVLTGSVRRSATHLKVSTQLLAGSNGAELWSETYDRGAGDAVEIQAGIAENIAASLRVKLLPLEKAALSAGGTANATAQDLVMQARAVWQNEASEQNGHAALAMLDRAIALDPEYFQARLERAGMLRGLAGHAHSPQEAQVLIGDADAEARLAIDLAPNLAAGYARLASVLEVALDFRGALAQFERAMAITPNDPLTLRRYSSYIAGLGRADEGIALAARAVALDPLDVDNLRSQGTAFFFAHRFSEAMTAYRHILLVYPKETETRSTLGDCLLLTGQYEAAQVEYAASEKEDSFRLTGEAIIAARASDRSMALAKLAHLRALYGDAASAQEAEIYAQLGDLHAAIAALERGWVAKDGGLAQISADPFLDPLRGDARFDEFMTKIGIP